MSLYNMMNGVNPATFFILPMLGKHAEEYPRFRDCWIGSVSRSKKLDRFGIPERVQDLDNPIISVYTRVGGGNRDSYLNEIEVLRNMEGYIRDFDDDFDSTYATFEFSVPKEFEEDYKKIVGGDVLNTSQAYKDMLYKVYPKLKDKFDEMFKSE